MIPSTERSERIEIALAAAGQQLDSLREQAHELYLKTVADETDAESAAQMMAKHALIDEMCRVLSNLSSIAEARIIRRNMQAFIDENAL